TPLVGHRLVELARPAGDAAEPLLAAAGARFVIPVPSREVRGPLGGERARRASRPLHDRQPEDAPPEVLRDPRCRLGGVGRATGLADGPGPASEAPYDPEVYGHVYAHVLARRRPEILPLDAILPTGALSVYDIRVPARDLVPTPAEAGRFVELVEAAGLDAGALRRTIDQWWVPDGGSPP